MLRNPTAKLLLDIFKKLYSHYGTQHWWPGDTPFEIAIGAILTQNTAWSNVESAIDNLKKAGFLGASTILALPLERLAELIRPSGYYNQKALKLKAFVGYLMERCDGDMERLTDVDTETLRRELLGIRGIGPETADDILLYALDRPVFVVDTYTYRLLFRHSLISEESCYDEIQSLFMDNLSHSVRFFGEYHALIVRVGKELCKKREPRCDACPLKDLR